MDMISWQSANGPIPELHTRYTWDVGYSNDYAIVTMFTNVMSAYGLSGLLAPIVRADYNPQSDHYRFWSKGYPAILAIEGYPDENPYYHRTSDTLQNINPTFYCDYVKAAIGTAAHLAWPVEQVDLDAIEIANGNWVYGSGVGIGTLYLRHLAGAQESVDTFDVAWSNAPANPNANWLRIHTAPYSTILETDARPTNSASYYYGWLSAVSTNGQTFSSTSRLRFGFSVWPSSNRVYLAHVRVDDRYTVGSNSYEVVTNIRQVVEGGGYLDLPALTNLTNGAVYGTIDISPQFLDLGSSNTVLELVSINPTQLIFSMPAQAGTRIIDTVQAKTNLLIPADWFVCGVFTNSPPPDLVGFTSGWQTAEWPMSSAGITNSSALYLRTLRRIELF